MLLECGEGFPELLFTYLGLSQSWVICGLPLKYMASSKTLCSAAFFLIQSWYSMYGVCSTGAFVCKHLTLEKQFMDNQKQASYSIEDGL